MIIILITIQKICCWLCYKTTRLTLGKILKARKETKGINVRQFRHPELQASINYDLLDWEKKIIKEPSMTMKYTDTNTEYLILSGNYFVEFEKFLRHSQAVERCVKLVPG